MNRRFRKLRSVTSWALVMIFTASAGLAQHPPAPGLDTVTPRSESLARVEGSELLSAPAAAPFPYVARSSTVMPHHGSGEPPMEEARPPGRTKWLILAALMAAAATVAVILLAGGDDEPEDSTGTVLSPGTPAVTPPNP